MQNWKSSSNLFLRKAQQPTTNKDGKQNRKVLVFTAFADTANYLYDNLQTWAAEALNIQCAVVTGSTNRTTFGRNNFDGDSHQFLTHL